MDTKEWRECLQITHAIVQNHGKLMALRRNNTKYVS